MVEPHVAPPEKRGEKADLPRRGFTPKFIESLRPKEKAYELRDPGAPGLRLRTHPSGVKTFRWDVRSLKRVCVLGPWSMGPKPAHLTLGQAHDWLRQLKDARKAGPEQLDAVMAQLKATLRPPRQAAPETNGPTVAQVAERFMKVLTTQRKRPDAARAVIDNDILPVIGHLPLHSLKKRDCIEVVRRVVDRGATVHAGKALSITKQLLDYAENVEEDFVNPAARLKASNLGVESNQRDRWLSEAEIPVFWKALDQKLETEPSRRSAPEPTIAAGLRVLLLTGLRSGELRLARWEHVDFAVATLTVPVASQKLTLRQAKQAKPFVVPLSAKALGLMQELKARAGERPWVLASDRGHLQHVAEKTLAQALRRAWRSHPELKQLPPATVHDLRRTCRSHLGKLGVSPHIAERCLNHRIGKIVDTYDRNDYLPERRAALEKWDAFIQRLLAPEKSNVEFLAAAGE